PPAATLDAAGAARLQLSWRAHLSGAIDGSPVVASRKVVAGSQNGELVAFDEKAGTELWKRTGLGPISGTPAIFGNRVFAATLTGHVQAFDLSDGRDVWDWKALGLKPALWSSPTIYNGLLLVGVGSQAGDTPLETGRIVALDAGTGRERWSTCAIAGCRPGGGIWSTPSIDSAGHAYVGVGNPVDGVLAFDARTGDRLWETSFYSDDGRDLDVGASPVLVDLGGREALAIGSVAGAFKMLDARSGAVIWSVDLDKGSAVHGLIATAAFDGVNLYVGSASPPTGLFARKLDGSDLWTFVTFQTVYSAPSAGNGVVVFGTGAVFGDLGVGLIIALSPKDGNVLWSYDAQSAVRSSPAITGSLVVVGDAAGDLFAFRPGS
ncbi:MAG TPA: PQQ-binding-like beta-propeller repeat protein, partial [Candidatus Dormibacteraeota bacterium]|nr:PQQ-binding-like beta-propeller repeat protein [Candidatus Dormibacteraeota bacterium]